MLAPGLEPSWLPTILLPSGILYVAGKGRWAGGRVYRGLMSYTKEWILLVLQREMWQCGAEEGSGAGKNGGRGGTEEGLGAAALCAGRSSPYWQRRLLSKSPTSIGENFTLSFWVFPTGTMPETGSTEKGGREASFQRSMALSRVLPVCSVPWLSWSFWEKPGGR